MLALARYHQVASSQLSMGSTYQSSSSHEQNRSVTLHVYWYQVLPKLTDTKQMLVQHCADSEESEGSSYVSMMYHDLTSSALEQQAFAFGDYLSATAIWSANMTTRGTRISLAVWLHPCKLCHVLGIWVPHLL